MPLGFANILAIFQLYINKYLIKKLNTFCIINLDNILIYINMIKVKNKKIIR